MKAQQPECWVNGGGKSEVPEGRLLPAANGAVPPALRILRTIPSTLQCWAHVSRLRRLLLPDSAHPASQVNIPFSK